ncbi:MAG: hypothetical protein JSW34_13045 [Candidatus Zixiibacteriota bacterium]|nr:MAG: hypothetical protein JSW34_13045 [candidate division Zixibacteria bacterium]
MTTDVFRREFAIKPTLAILFATSFAYVEAVVVVYLRNMIYPAGFAFPLKVIPPELITVELLREAATMVMLVAVALLCGRRRWERFGYFIAIFGMWDIFYYVWLKATIDWPGSFLEWDVLFLIPLPWIGPVIAPLLISLLMTICGFIIIGRYAQGRDFSPGMISWVLAAVATALILLSFMRDTDATLHQQMPQPYWYPALMAGLMLYIVAFVMAYARSARVNQPKSSISP